MNSCKKLKKQNGNNKDLKEIEFNHCTKQDVIDFLKLKNCKCKESDATETFIVESCKDCGGIKLIKKEKD